MTDFAQWLDRFVPHKGQAPTLIRTMVELTYGCNLRCVHCYNPTHEAKGELSTGQVFRILDQLAQQGVMWIGLTGGELLTRRDAFEIFRYAKPKGFLISLLTNATMVTSEVADRLQEIAPYQIDVSIYGGTAATYEKVTRVPGSFSKFVGGVNLLMERGLSILLKIVLMTLNVHELDQMREFARSRKLPYRVSTEITPKVDGSEEPLAYRLPPEQAFEVWRQISGDKIKQNLHPDLQEEDRCGSAGKLFDCRCGKSGAAITPYGRMNLCVSTQYPQYDLTQGTVAEGWETLVKIVSDAKPSPEYECQECGLARHCTRGTMDGWLEQGTFDGPCIPHFREIAQKKSTFLGESFTV